MRDDVQSLVHTTWNCKYHIVFAPKYRRQIFYGEHRTEIGAILRELCEWRGIEIIEAEVCPDHIHMLLSIPPKYAVSSVMGFLKGKSSLMIHERHGNLKYKYGNRSFWCRGFYVDTVGKNVVILEVTNLESFDELIVTTDLPDGTKTESFIMPADNKKTIDDGIDTTAMNYRVYRAAQTRYHEKIKAGRPK